MRIIEPAFIVETRLNGEEILKTIERFTRKCYKSEHKTTETSYLEFVPRVFQTRKHRGIIEHCSVSVTFFTDRGVTHELVRHRIASYLQESTRYCNYAVNGRFRGVTFVMPPWLEAGTEDFLLWSGVMADAERNYNRLLQRGWKPEEARDALPHATKAEITATLNLGSWHNFFVKRVVAGAHPKMRQLAVPLLRAFQERIPVLFADILCPQLPYREAREIHNESQLQEVLTGEIAA